MSVDRLAFRRLQVAAMYLLLGPLIIVLGTVDMLSSGRSRNWPLSQ
jgi:hypothetical protein